MTGDRFVSGLSLAALGLSLVLLAETAGCGHAPVPAPLPVPAPTPAPAPVPWPAPHSGPAEDAPARFLRLVNEARRHDHAGPLRLDPRLSAAAEMSAADCARLRRLDHVTSNGWSSVDRITAAGYPSGWTGEVIAEGQTTVDQAVADWLADPSHARVMLDAHYRDVGFATAQDTAGSSYWTADFGAPP